MTTQTLKMLIELAKQKGIKYNTRMTKKTLCMHLGIELLPPPPKPTKVTLTNIVTGEVLKYVSTYRAAKELGINRGLIAYYAGRNIKIGDETYLIKRL